MTQTVVGTLTLAESGEKEEAVNEQIEDAGFIAERPQVGDVKVWVSGSTYAKGDLVREPNKQQVYKSTENANKEHKPSEDADYTHWQPVARDEYLLQNPNYVTEDKTYTQRPREQIIGVPTTPGADIYPFDKAKKYPLGAYSTEGGFGYEAIKAATENEAPSTHPLAWKKLGPSIGFGI